MLHQVRESMEWDITHVEPLAPLTLRVQFADGTVGRVRSEPSRLAEVLYSTHVRGQFIFQQGRAEDGFVTWPGDLDLVA